MFENYIVLVKSDLDGQLRLIRADEYSISDGELLGFVAPEALNPDDLCEIYEELEPNEDFIVEPLNYSGDNFDEARLRAASAHPDGWEPAEDFDGYICYNGVYPFKTGGKWYAIQWYWEDIMDI